MEQPDIEKEGGDYWTEEIKKAGYFDQLRPFNDVITGQDAPRGYGEPVLRDVVLGQKNCDIYHTDKKPSDTYHRIFVHIKD